MRTTHLLFSAVQFIFVVVLFLIGGLFLGMEHSPQIRALMVRFVAENQGTMAIVGYGVVGCAFLLLCGFFSMHRGSYYQIEMQRSLVHVEPDVVRDYVQSYWNDIFPGQKIEAEVVFHGKRKIEIIARAPDFDEEAMNHLLPQIEEELGLLLAHAFGYRREFLLTMTLP